MLRKAKKEDLEIIQSILNDGKEFLKEQNINQWQHGSPSIKDVENDLKEDTAFVYEKENKIVATLKITPFDSDYEKTAIFEKNTSYLAIHRFAVAKSVRSQGISKEIISKIKEYAKINNIKYLRIDTHKSNNIMRKFLSNNEFKELGVIELTMKNILDDKERIAYEYKV